MRAFDVRRTKGAINVFDLVPIIDHVLKAPKIKIKSRPHRIDVVAGKAATNTDRLMTRISRSQRNKWKPKRKTTHRITGATHVDRTTGSGDRPGRPHHALSDGEGRPVSEIDLHQPEPQGLVRGRDVGLAE